jgi:hypothetical protein
VDRGLSIVKSGQLQPADRETVFCKTLVVGNTVAAYTAALAILQAGEQVCWAQTGPVDIVTELSQAQVATLATAKFSWRLGRRASSWETATVMSQSQQAFWSHWRPPQLAASAPTSAKIEKRAAPWTATPPSKETQLRQAIAPYIASQKLILIPQGLPVRVLYAEKRGQKRVYQVVFQDAATKRRFQVHAKLILDATRNAALQQYFQGVRGELPTTELMLTTEHLASANGAARGTFFEDTIALAMTPDSPGWGRSRPLAIPLRALIPKDTEGLLCVSFPGCEPSLRPIFRQPRARWAIGEAAGHIAAKAAQVGGVLPLMQQPRWQWRLQRYLVQQDIPLFAFDDIGLDDPDFEAIQMVAIANVVRTMRQRDLSFRPETPITKAVLASALSRLPAQPQLAPNHTDDVSLQDVDATHWAANAIQAMIASQTLSEEAPETFVPNKVLTKRQLWQVLQSFYPTNLQSPPFPQDDSPARRRHLSRALYPIVRSRLG